MYTLDDINTVTWFHSIKIGSIITPGTVSYNSLLTRLELIGLPDDLSGKSVLDVGAADGFFSFECKRRNAKRVLALDWSAWGNFAEGGIKKEYSKESFDIANELLGLDVESIVLSVYNLSPDLIGKFDIVLCMGVLYHLWHPFLAIEKLETITNDMLILRWSQLMPGEDDRSIMEFLNGKHVTFWWRLSNRCVFDMLQTVGFRKIVRPNKSIGLFYAYKEEI